MDCFLTNEWKSKKKKRRVHSQRNRERIEKYWEAKKAENGNTVVYTNDHSKTEPLENENENENIIDNKKRSEENLKLNEGTPVSAVISVWQKYFPAYLQDWVLDFPAAAKIAGYVRKEQNLIDLSNVNQIERRWGEVVEFIAEHNHFQNYSLSQVAKHFQSILSSINGNKNFKRNNAKDTARPGSKLSAL